MKIYLTSKMSGDDIRTYELSNVSSKTNPNSHLSQWIKGPLTLFIALPDKAVFQINGYYGFAPAALRSIDEQLK
ncbi:MAG: hypothetical protein PSX81_15875 [bacterium]|nr:hypothetical protein [bacterium]